MARTLKGEEKGKRERARGNRKCAQKSRHVEKKKMERTQHVEVIGRGKETRGQGGPPAASLASFSPVFLPEVLEMGSRVERCEINEGHVHGAALSFIFKSRLKPMLADTGPFLSPRGHCAMMPNTAAPGKSGWRARASEICRAWGLSQRAVRSSMAPRYRREPGGLFPRAREL